MSYKLRILSLGAGVQSSTILLMACKGLLPRPDAAIFANTGWETNATYIHLEWLKVEAGKHGIEVIVCNNGDVREIIPTIKNPTTMHRSFMPFFTRTEVDVYDVEYDDEDNEVSKVWSGSVNSRGMLWRQCTQRFKLTPIKRTTRKALGIAPKQRAPKDCVEQWIGISTDEYHRIFSRHKDRMTFLRYPLIEMNMSRLDCARWLMDNYQITVPKSSCVGCPYHCDTEWRTLSPEEFRAACEFDNKIRNRVGLKGQAYLHRSCVLLSEVDLRTPEDRGQQVFDFAKDEKLNLFVNNISIHT